MRVSKGFYWNLRHKCMKKRCRSFHACYSPFAPTGLNLQLLALCPNPEITAMFRDYSKKQAEFEAKRKSDKAKLWKAVYEDFKIISAKYFPEQKPKVIPVKTWMDDIREAAAAFDSQEGRAVELERERRSDELREEFLESARKDGLDLSEYRDIVKVEDGEFEFWNEILSAAKVHLDNPPICPSDRRMITEFASQLNPNKEVVFECSFNLKASGVLRGVLIPSPINQVNRNNFAFDEEELPNILEQLNSGQIVLRDTHSKKLSDIVGVVQKATVDSNGNVIIESIVDDEKVSRLLTMKGKKFFLSVGGSADFASCSICGKKLSGVKDFCPNHPQAPKTIHNVKVTEVSLLSEFPAYPRSEVLEFQPD